MRNAVIFLMLYILKNYEGDPLSPPEGEAAQGEHPPAPSTILPFSGESRVFNLRKMFPYPWGSRAEKIIATSPNEHENYILG